MNHGDLVWFRIREKEMPRVGEVVGRRRDTLLIREGGEEFAAQESMCEKWHGHGMFGDGSVDWNGCTWTD
jgi:hypothetical protein